MLLSFYSLFDCLTWVSLIDYSNVFGPLIVCCSSSSLTINTSIATMMANRSDDPAVKTTLIVAPLALLGQWKLEIEMKTNDVLSVHIYHGYEKAKSKKTLQKADVVLTTYGVRNLLAADLRCANVHFRRLPRNGSTRKSS